MNEDIDRERRIQNAIELASQGELSHAARNLQSNGIAEGSEQTLRELQDPRLRPQNL